MVIGIEIIGAILVLTPDYIIYLKKYFDSGSTLSVKFQRADINKHNSDKNFLAKNNFIFNEISTGYKFNLYKNFDAYFNFIARKSKLMSWIF